MSISIVKNLSDDLRIVIYKLMLVPFLCSHFVNNNVTLKGKKNRTKVCTEQQTILATNTRRPLSCVLVIFTFFKKDLFGHLRRFYS